MDEDWDAAWSDPSPQPQVHSQHRQTERRTGSMTFTNSNRGGRRGGRGRGRGGRGRSNNSIQDGARSHNSKQDGDGWIDFEVESTGGWQDLTQEGWNPPETFAEPPKYDFHEPQGNPFKGGGWADIEISNRFGGYFKGRERAGRRSNLQDRNQKLNINEKCEIMLVPTRMVGKIIGRGGLQIDELQMRSLACIQVTRDTNDDKTVVKIYGDDSAINRAKELINEVIEEKSKEQHREQPKKEAPKPKEPENDQAQAKPYDWFKYLKECDARVEAEWNKLPPIIKNFYREHPEVSAMTDEQVEQFREKSNNIVVSRTFAKEDSKPIPKPVTTFEQAFHHFPDILEEIYKAGFQTPSPIQCQAWPVLLSGEDLIGIAQTGTGKTLAFLLPALIHIDCQLVPREERGGPAVLIMAPTRELALQIDKEVKKYEYRGITSCCVYGGGDRKTQINVVSSGVDIVIATPGRMNDLEEAGHLNVRSVTYVVLDEADRMLDMGFEPQIRKVMYSLRPKKQCVMTSATWPPGVRRLADSYMSDPIQVYVGSLDLAATHTVTQVIQIMDEKDKEECFMNFAKNLGPDEKLIVFCGTKAKADYLSVECALANIPCTSLHGNRDQSDREQAVEDIQSGYVNILIATDVASRGLDIDDVTHVINYDFPKNIEEYVHRVGRTGRAGKSGESISYFTRNDWAQAAELIKILEEAQQFVPEEIYEMAVRFEVMKERRERTGEPVRRGGGRGRGRRY